MSQHTPGPWALSFDDRDGMEWNIHVVRADKPHLAVCFMTSDGPNEANARLIAAAPELLDACQAMAEWDAREQDHAVDFAERTKMCIAAFDKARAAIAKATQVEP